MRKKLDSKIWIKTGPLANLSTNLPKKRTNLLTGRPKTEVNLQQTDIHTTSTTKPNDSGKTQNRKKKGKETEKDTGTTK